MSKETSRSPNAPKAGSKKSTPAKKRSKEGPVEDADDRRAKQSDYSDKYSSGRKMS